MQQLNLSSFSPRRFRPGCLSLGYGIIPLMKITPFQHVFIDASGTKPHKKLISLGSRPMDATATLFSLSTIGITTTDTTIYY
jgi:hypothetical protein